MGEDPLLALMALGARPAIADRVLARRARAIPSERGFDTHVRDPEILRPDRAA